MLYLNKSQIISTYSWVGERKQLEVVVLLWEIQSDFAGIESERAWMAMIMLQSFYI